MMSSVMLLLLMATATAASVPQTPPTAEEEAEILVIANRLNSWRGSVRLSDDRARCRTTRSTGDRRIDRIGCDAMTYCFVEVRSQMSQASAAQDEVNPALGQCFIEQRRQRIRAYRASQRRR
jgi:hypothetical protein